MSITCFLFLVTLSTVAARRARQSGSSVGVQFAGTIAVNNSDARSNQTEAIQEDAMLDDLLNSQMEAINQSMPPPMKKVAKKAQRFISRVCRKKNLAKVVIKKNISLQELPMSEFGVDGDITELALAINPNWMIAYLEGTSVCRQDRALSDGPEQITRLTRQEEEAIGMYTASDIFAEVNNYMSLIPAEQKSLYPKPKYLAMNRYIQIVKDGLLKIQGLTEYASQEEGGDTVQILYRGFGHSTNWTHPDGQTHIRSFWSTSEDQQIALGFMPMGGGKDYTLLEITGGLQFARPIAFLSCRPDELEFLFLPGATFKVNAVRNEVIELKKVKVVTGVVVGR